MDAKDMGIRVVRDELAPTDLTHINEYLGCPQIRADRTLYVGGALVGASKCRKDPSRASVVVC